MAEFVDIMTNYSILNMSLEVFLIFVYPIKLNIIDRKSEESLIITLKIQRIYLQIPF